ncbi:MAG: hypothetical protein O7F71_08905, partial [Gammaproteobacteria bacterium]|nr:hypothetical protein [Gammaproteobacteria bacterium]
MRKLLVLWIIGLVTLQACVEFERQTIQYRHDTERDELRMLMIYDGIYGEKARDYPELRSVLLRPRTFIFSNWVFEYDRDEIVQQLEELKGEQDTKLTLSLRRLFSLLLDNVRVDNGVFYLNNENKLAGYQQVTLSKVSELVAAFNQMVNTGLIHDELDPTDFPFASSQSAYTIRRAAWAGHRWIELEQGELRIRL